MTNTKTKKIVAIAWVLAILWTNLLTSSLWTTYADVKIGTGSVSGTGAYDTDIMWNETYTSWSASGSISWIKVTARVLPTLSMIISDNNIDLWDLRAGITATGGLNLEIGTNAKAWVTITARSWSGWLTKLDDNSIQINDLSTDWVSESYTYESTPNSTNDSSSSTFSASWLANIEVNNNTIEHAIYTTNKPELTENVDDLDFVVSATINAETPAWEYEDTITFTVTWNF